MTTIRNQIERLSPSQRETLRERLASRLAESRETSSSTHVSKVELAAFVSAERSAAHTVTSESLRAALQTCLPAYMIPNPIQIVDTIPKNANGKTDRHALAGLAKKPISPKQEEADSDILSVFKNRLGLSDIERNADFFQLGGDSITALSVVSDLRKLGYPVTVSDLFQRPNPAALVAFLNRSNDSLLSQTESRADEAKWERKIVAVFKELLGSDEIDKESDFFAVGGDSLMAIQAVARLRDKDVNTNVSHIFQYRSARKLAAGLAKGDPVPSQELLPLQTASVSYFVPFTPIQEWFFEQSFSNPNHWNQSLILELPRNTTFSAFRAAMHSLYETHPALRLCIERKPTRLVQRIKPYVSESVPCRQLHISDSNSETAKNSLETEAEKLQLSVSLDSGQLLHAAYVTLREEQPPQAVLVAHHFCVDAVSWKILLDELASLLERLKPTIQRIPNDRNALYRNWLSHLSSLANSSRASDTLRYCREWLRDATKPLPLDQGDRDSDNTEGAASQVTLEFDEETTARLTRISTHEGLPLNELALAAVAKALVEWTGPTKLLVGVEGHGRERIDNATDPSDLVGWFTSYFPISIDLRDASSLQQVFNEVSHSLQVVPNKGFDYGLVRYLRTKYTEVGLFEHQDPEIVFNYLGRIDLPANNALRLISRKVGTDRDPANGRTSLFEIDVYLEADRLKLAWIYSAALHRRSTVSRLVEHVASDLHGLAQRHSGKNPPARDSFLSNKPGAYPLNDAQQSLLLHHLGSRRNDLAALAIRADIKGPLDQSQANTAWNRLVQRHPALRSSFDWRSSSEAKIVCHPHEQIEVTYWDISDRSQADQQRFADELVARFKREARSLDALPNHEVAILKHESRRHTLIWGCHHAFVDGWSGNVVLQDFLRELANPSSSLKPAAEGQGFHAYYQWLERQSLSHSRRYWETRLEDAVPCSIGNSKHRPHGQLAPGGSRGLVALNSNLATQESLKSKARELGATVNALAIAAWARTLSLLTDNPNVCFGLIQSGRNLPFENPDRIVGNLANVVPFPIQIHADVESSHSLKTIMRLQEQSSRFCHQLVPKVLQARETRVDASLFDTTITLTSYPKIEACSHFSLLNLKGDTTSAYPLSLTVSIEPGEAKAYIDFDQRFHTEEAMLDTLTLYNHVLANLTTPPAAPFAETLARTRRRFFDSPIADITHSTPAESAKARPGTDSTVESITKLFCEVLSNADISPDDSFFELGGSSLQAVRLVGRLNDRYGKNLPVSRLLSCPSPSALARCLEKRTPANREFGHLVSMRTSDLAPPLFLVHSGGTQVLFYRQLTESLDPRIPVWLIQPRGHDGTERPDDSIPEMASRYLEEIQKVCPEGPKAIAGHCFGAAIAIEMGKQLQRRDAKPELIISLDGEAPQISGHRQASKWERILRGDLTPYKAYRIARRMVTGSFEKLTDDWLLKRGSAAKKHEIVLRLMQQNYLRAYQSYQTESYNGKVLALRCVDSDFHPNHSAQDWLRAAPESTIVELSCKHDELLLAPYAQKTATTIQKELSKIEAYSSLSAYRIS